MRSVHAVDQVHPVPVNQVHMRGKLPGPRNCSQNRTRTAKTMFDGV